jgi:hypothetical protein
VGVATFPRRRPHAILRGKDMIPGQYDLKIYQGATINVLIEWLDGATTLPVDLTGCTAVATFRETVDDTNPLFTLTSGDGIVLGGTAGTIHMLAPSPLASVFDSTRGEWDLLVTDADGNTDAVLRGNVRFIRAVTR